MRAILLLGINLATLALPPAAALAAVGGADFDNTAQPEMAPQVPLAATLNFKPSAEVEGERLYLGGLAECQGMREICSEVYGIDLGPSPEPGRSVAWHPDKIKGILSKEWPNADIRIAGSKVTKITATSIPLTEDKVEAALRSLLDDHFAADSLLKVTVDKIMLPPGLRLRPGEYLIEFPDLTREHLEAPDWVIKRLSGNTRLAFVCRQLGGDESRTVLSASVHLSVQALTPVLSIPLAKGDELTESNLTSEMITLGRTGTHFVSHFDELKGRRLRRPLPAGSPVLPSDIELPRLVHRGQMVRLKVDGENVAISGSVKLMADGVTGQVIDAQYPATKKKMRVRVIDANTVQHVF